MKNIYELLNDSKVEVDFDEKLQMTDLEIYTIVHKVSRKKNQRRLKYGLTSVMCILMIFIILGNNSLYTKASTQATKLMQYIQGNYKNDYVKKISKIAKTNSVSVNLLDVERVDGEITLKYDMKFDADITNMIKNSDAKDESIFYSSAFDQCTFYINGINMKKDLDDTFEKLFRLSSEQNITTKNNEKYSLENDPERNNPFSTYEVKDITISKNEIIQKISFLLKDPNYNEDIDILLSFSKIKLSEETRTGDCNLDYVVKADNAKLESQIRPLDLYANTSDDIQYHITGYSYTNTGLKIYATLINPEKKVGEGIIFIVGKDEKGNQYEFYPTFDTKDLSKAVFTIYDGPADLKNEYKDSLADGISQLSCFVNEENINWKKNTTSDTKISKDFTTELKLQ